MPTQSTTYNTRLTDEALERRFRETFRSQGGAELVDDLYASGVIVPVVDFTAAAEGSGLRQDLQTAWDASTNHIKIQTNTPQLVVETAGFWKFDFTVGLAASNTGTSSIEAAIYLDDGTTARPIWQYNAIINQTGLREAMFEESFVVFLGANDYVTAKSQGTDFPMNIWYRQIADVSGALVNPDGFTSS